MPGLQKIVSCFAKHPQVKHVTMIRQERLSPTQSDVNLDCIDQDLPWLPMVPQTQSDTNLAPVTAIIQCVTIAVSDEIFERLSKSVCKPQNSVKFKSQYTPDVVPKKPSRYRKYEGRDMVKAIDEILTGNMSALMAAKKYGIPSRTLYDKVKKIRSGSEVCIRHHESCKS